MLFFRFAIITKTNNRSVKHKVEFRDIFANKWHSSEYYKPYFTMNSEFENSPVTFAIRSNCIQKSFSLFCRQLFALISFALKSYRPLQSIADNCMCVTISLRWVIQKSRTTKWIENGQMYYNCVISFQFHARKLSAQKTFRMHNLTITFYTWPNIEEI